MKQKSIWVTCLLTLLVASPIATSCTTSSTDTPVTSLRAEDYAIQFTTDTWDNIVKKAKAENKLIFIDFYTQWCGPCYNMAISVFTQPNVGQFYNKHFVCVKIDAEEEAGSALAKKYKVRSYPTYAFVDPTSEELVHISSSRQTDQEFIYTGKSALDPTKRSTYLLSEYEKGNRDTAFLVDYIRYTHSIFAHRNARKAFDELIAKGETLTNPTVWNVFCETINGITPYLKEVSTNYDKYCDLYGKKNVDAKFCKETQYGDLAMIEKLCDFEGKEFNCEMIRLSNLVYRQKNYDEAIKKIDALLADSSTDKQKLIDRLKYLVRISHYDPKDLPAHWYAKCLEYLRYIAYNNKERDNANIHFEYAVALENLLKHTTNIKDIPATLLKTPTNGKTEYSMRPDALKMKPRATSKVK